MDRTTFAQRLRERVLILDGATGTELQKRGMVGTYQHCGEQHLHRYLAEFDFRQSNRARLGVNDDLRANRILKGAEGKRLTYRQTAD